MNITPIRESRRSGAPIYTVTLNPAVDQAIWIDEVTLGAINRCELDSLDPGGKGLNASRVIHRLGRKTLALGFVGGVIGEMIRSHLTAEGVPHDFDEVSGLTRLNVMLYERRSARRTGFYLPGARVNPAQLRALYEHLSAVPAGGVVVLAGSLPPGLTTEVYPDLVSWLTDRGIQTIVDVSGPALAAVLEAGPTLIKPNVDEAAEVLGTKLRDDREVRWAAEELQARGVENVVISQGAQGAIGVGDAGCFKATPPTIVQRSSVGSGDSMVAGLAIALNEGTGLLEGLRLGTAAGAATAMTHGTQLANADQVAALLPQVQLYALPAAAAA